MPQQSDELLSGSFVFCAVRHLFTEDSGRENPILCVLLRVDGPRAWVRPVVGFSLDWGRAYFAGATGVKAVPFAELSSAEGTAKDYDGAQLIPRPTTATLS